jgi:hypothetical protein
MCNESQIYVAVLSMDKKGFCIPKINNSHLFKNKMGVFVQEEKKKEGKRRQSLLGLF